MFTAVRKGGRPNAVADVANYGTVSGSARQLVYRGPVLDATDVGTQQLKKRARNWSNTTRFCSGFLVD